MKRTTSALPFPVALTALIITAACASSPPPAPPTPPPVASVPAPPAPRAGLEAASVYSIEPPAAALRAADHVALTGLELGTMWTFENPPLDYWKTQYDFTATPEWLNHVRLASVRYGEYCSASFVSPNGLVMTNHHCARECVESNSTPSNDYVVNGFSAATKQDELLCDGLFLDQLVGIEDVTARVRGAAPAGASDVNVATAQSAETDKIQNECEAKTGDTCQVVALFQGGQYQLYHYKRYQPVKLVFAPELQAGFFGGDPDNFTYPRYDLDFSFVRAYSPDSTTPVSTPDYFQIDPDGGREGNVVFVTGNPGSTSRLITVSQLMYERTYRHPFLVQITSGQRKLLQAIAARGPQYEMQVREDLFGVENSLKAYTGELSGLRDTLLVARKIKWEREFRSRVDADPKLKAEYGNVWQRIADLQIRKLQVSPRLNVSNVNLIGSPHFGIAGQLVTYVTEMAKPEAQRSEQFRANAAQIRAGLTSPSMVDPEIANGLLEMQIGLAASLLGSSDPLRAVLIRPGESAEAAAARLARDSKIMDPTFRRSIVDGGPAALAATTDPILAFARDAATLNPKLTEEWTSIQAAETVEKQRLASALFAVYGTSLPPDATFTLRISDGVVKRYPYNGTTAPPFTTFYGLFARSADFGNQNAFRAGGEGREGARPDQDEHAARLRVHARHHGRQQRQPDHRQGCPRRRTGFRRQYRAAAQRVPVPRRRRPDGRRARGGHRRSAAQHLQGGGAPPRAAGERDRRRQPMSDTHEYMDRHQARFAEELFEFLRIPSISADSAYKAQTRQAADWLAAKMKDAGLEVSIHETPGHPIVLGEWRAAGSSAPTVLIYGHYDVQPADPLELWDSPPFEPEVRDGRIYARGSVDDKGQLYLHVKALEAAIRTHGKLPCNVVLIAEGEEEVGSENLMPFVEKNAKRLACDYIVISDSSMMGPGMPTIGASLRGLAYFELRVTGPGTDLHSGSYGGAVLNPATALSRIIASFHDENWHITIPGFYDDVHTAPEFREQIRKLPFDEAGFLKETGSPLLVGEKGQTTYERLWVRPTCEVCGLLSGYTGEGSKTVLPSKAMAKVSFRLVPDQDPDRIRELFKAHIDKVKPEGVTVDIVVMHGGKPWRAKLEGPLVEAGARALEKAWGKPVMYAGEGGSIPIIPEFERVLNAPTLLMGFGLPGENAHAPNEWMSVDCYQRGTHAAAALLEELGKR